MSNTMWAEAAVRLDIPGARTVFPNAEAVERFCIVIDQHIAERAKAIFEKHCHHPQALAMVSECVNSLDITDAMRAQAYIHFCISLTKCRPAHRARMHDLLRRLIEAGVWYRVQENHLSQGKPEIDGGF